MMLHEMAHRIGCFVCELVSIPNDEFIKWQMFFERRPIGWREDDRTMKLLQAQGVKEKASNIFESLAVMAEYEEKQRKERTKINKLSSANLKRSAMFSKLLGAKGGDKLDVL